MSVSSLNATRIVLSEWSSFVDAFPGAASATGHAIAIALPCALLFGLIGLWFWRRWAVWWLAVVTLATIAFDLVARGPLMHVCAALGSAVLMACAIYANRRRFGFSAA
ncbi:MAG: hypothetical protein E6Q88_05955 [Lysobacteraceae bacterium]|nr:MAG: hypothetical protein E6Q88_05955 [Xanthomonadaceae bacterium]